MRKVKEILRLHFEAPLSELADLEDLPGRERDGPALPEEVESGRSELALARRSERSHPGEEAVPASATPSAAERPAPDCPQIHKEPKSPNVTLQLLWEEYKQAHPDGYNYSWYCQLYRQWTRHVDIVLRQEHRAGEKMFVDHAGQTVLVIERSSGETREAYVFVAVLGASNYTYAEATWTRGLWDWISSHNPCL
jgi:transposase